MCPCFPLTSPITYWRRFLPKSTPNGWLWGYGIWCCTIDSRCGAKFIYNKDQYANTYVSVWGLFPVGKIWSSHSTIKSRFDKPWQNRFPLNFLELPHWVPPHRFRWNLLPSNLDLTSHNKASLHQSFCKSLSEFLCTDFLIKFLCRDLDGNLSFTLNPLTASKLGHFINIVWGTIRNCKQRQNVWSTCVEWKKQALLHGWDSWHCSVCNTDSPNHIHIFILPEVWKAFNVRINAWNITAVLYSNGDRTTWLSPFPWRFSLIHLKVHACYSCWLNWRNSIMLGHMVSSFTWCEVCLALYWGPRGAPVW